MTEMQRMTIIHEQGHDGGEYYRFAPGAPKSPGADDEAPGKAKGASTKKAVAHAKKDRKPDDSKDAAGAEGKKDVKAEGFNDGAAGEAKKDV